MPYVQERYHDLDFRMEQQDDLYVVRVYDDNGRQVGPVLIEPMIVMFACTGDERLVQFCQN